MILKILEVWETMIEVGSLVEGHKYDDEAGERGTFLFLEAMGS